jgi:CheY-like chemotaxis protein
MKAQQLPLNYRSDNPVQNKMETDSLNFVIVDDDSINNMVCRAAIKSATGGKVAVCFNNPREGLKYFEHEYLTAHDSHPTVLFLDINMPEMSGWEWLEKYDSFPKNIKEKVIIYILSSSVNPTDIDQAQSSSLVKDYIVKPLTKAKVIDLLEETIRNRQS